MNKRHLRNLIFAGLLLGGTIASVTGCPASNSQDAPSPDAQASAAADANDAGQQAAGYGHGAKVDPIKENGPIFESWPQAGRQFALVLSGRQAGYLEPCGCAGLENQKGGLARRHTLIKQLAEQGWPVVPLDLGGQIRRSGPQPDIKFEKTIDALHTMGYKGVALGADDLRLLSPDMLLLQLAGDPERAGLFVAANITVAGIDIAKFHVIEAGGKKIGVTAILGDQYRQEIDNSELELTDAQAALAEVTPQLVETGADHLVLLSHATPEESRELARAFPQYDIVVTAGGADEPPLDFEKIEGNDARLVEMGRKGMYVAVLGFFDDPQQPVRYQRVPLDSRFEASDAMQAMMVEYQAQLKALGWEGLGLLPVSHPRAEGPDDPAGKFVGSQTCGQCHKKAFAIWDNAQNFRDHAHVLATKTLTKLDPPRQFDPECVSCHVTGWNPKEYFPYESGFIGLEATGHLTGNGCENCHGPGGAHVQAELSTDRELKEKLRQTMRLTKAEAEKNLCVSCHDADNSPHFDFDTYWPKIEHKGKD